MDQQQIIKFCNITTEQVGALDKLVGPNGTLSGARRKRVRADGAEGYIYEIEVPMVVSSTVRSEFPKKDYQDGWDTKHKTTVTHPSRDVMNAIYDALGVFPATEVVKEGEWV